MKKIILSLGVFLFATCAVMAQDKKTATPTAVSAPKSGATTSVKSDPSVKAPNLKIEDMAFKTDTHDFGDVPEGPAADYEFTFLNNGKEPIVIKDVHASCGCTTPSYSKEPILPGKTGSVKASYNTVGRPNAFTKTITVNSNAGTKVLTIKGNVEKAPESSVPQNTSMMKTR